MYTRKLIEIQSMYCHTSIEFQLIDVRESLGQLIDEVQNSVKSTRIIG